MKKQISLRESAIKTFAGMFTNMEKYQTCNICGNTIVHHKFKQPEFKIRSPKEYATYEGL